MENKLDELREQIENLIAEYNAEAQKTKSLSRTALVIVDQSIELSRCYDEEIEDLEWGSGNFSEIKMFPSEMEGMFYDRGWFPSDFC